MNRFVPESVDEYGLLRNQDEEILVYRAMRHEDMRPPAEMRRFVLITAFHGLVGVYGGNTPESVEEYPMPYSAAIALPEDTEVTDLRHINNAQWTGRFAVNAIRGKLRQQHDELVVIRPTFPGSLFSHQFRGSVNGTEVDPSWVIIPHKDYVAAPKQIIGQKDIVKRKFLFFK